MRLVVLRTGMRCRRSVAAGSPWDGCGPCSFGFGGRGVCTPCMLATYARKMASTRKGAPMEDTTDTTTQEQQENLPDDVVVRAHNPLILY